MRTKHTAHRKFRKKVLLPLLLFACLSGCSSNAEPSAAYTPDTSPGTRTEVPLAQVLERQNNGEQMLVLFVQDGCSYCTAFNEIVDTYIKNHNIDLNIVNLTTEEAYNPKEDIKSALNAAVGGIEQTPALYYIESKDNVHLLDYTSGDYTLDTLTEFITKYQLDALEPEK